MEQAELIQRWDLLAMCVQIVFMSLIKIFIRKLLRKEVGARNDMSGGQCGLTGR